MNALTNFVFDADDGTPRAVRTLSIDGEPWFVATDVAAVLGYRNAPDMVRNLDDDEKGTQIVRTLGGTQEVSIINEPGLYAAIMRSRKPEAKAFKKWVTAEVLPSIRKTGAYVEPGAQLGSAPGAAPVQFLSHGADILVAADRTFRGALRSARSAGLPLPRALRRANEICLARTGLDMLTELDAHDQLTPPTAATQTTPGHLQAQVAEFAAALAAGEVSGAVLPMLTTQLYRFYTWWCRANQVPPASQVRFAALMVQGGVYHPRRKRYTNHAGEAVGPMAVVMPAGEGAPPHQHEPDWLGQHIARATQALANLNA